MHQIIFQNCAIFIYTRYQLYKRWVYIFVLYSITTLQNESSSHHHTHCNYSENMEIQIPASVCLPICFWFCLCVCAHRACWQANNTKRAKPRVFVFNLAQTERDGVCVLLNGVSAFGHGHATLFALQHSSGVVTGLCGLRVPSQHISPPLNTMAGIYFPRERFISNNAQKG